MNHNFIPNCNPKMGDFDIIIIFMFTEEVVSFTFTIASDMVFTSSLCPNKNKHSEISFLSQATTYNFLNLSLKCHKILFLKQIFNIPSTCKIIIIRYQNNGSQNLKIIYKEKKQYNRIYNFFIPSLCHQFPVN